MSRRIFGLVVPSVVWPCALATLFFACAELKRADEAAAGPDGGDAATTVEAGSDVEDGATADSAPPDAGPPPADFECDGDVWTKTTKTNPACAARQVSLVESIAPVDLHDVSIARTPAGRVGIAYYSGEGPDSGALRFAHFTPTTSTYAPPKFVKATSYPTVRAGYLVKLAASAPDTLALLALDLEDTGFGDVHLRTLVTGNEPLTDDVIATNVASPTEIAVASDLSGTVYATVRLPTGTTTAKLAAYRKPAGGVVGMLGIVAATMTPGETPGAGAASFFVDPGDQVHLLYHHSELSQKSTPRYHTLQGTSWSYRKTVDNNFLDGVAGFSPRIATFGTRKYAAYFVRKGSQAPPGTADLRLATFSSVMDTPQIEILQQQIPSADPADPAYRVAMAVDKFGLVHLAMVLPSTPPTRGTLDYVRQTRGADGTTKWLTDTVDDDVLTALTPAFVDMVVDENARPHIAYRSGKDGTVRYATRFDR